MTAALGVMWIALGLVFAFGGDDKEFAAWFCFGSANLFVAASLIISAIEKAGRK